MIFDPWYFVWIAPAFLLALWAQSKVKSTYAAAARVPAQLSGAAAARHILDSAGLNDVAIEQIAGQLTDHYDPHSKVLRLSSDVYQGRNMASVGIAAHESGHALQDAAHYSPLVVRNLAVPAANFGSGVGVWLIIIGLFTNILIAWVGIALFACVAFFQLVNLPVEFNASSRAKALLVDHGIVDANEMQYVNNVLDAAAWTYVAATLQSVLMLLYYITRLNGGSNRE